MNPEKAACIKCLVQCKLEDVSTRIIEGYKPDDDSKELNIFVSNMSQMASGIKCPTSEIDRVRTKTFNETDPKLNKGSNAHLFFKDRSPRRDYD